MALAGLGLVTRAAGGFAFGAAQTPLVQGVGLSSLGPDFKFDVSKKRPATLQLIGGSDAKRLRLSDFVKLRKRKRGGGMARRRFRRRFRRRRRARGKRTFRRFARRVKRVILRTQEPKNRLAANNLAFNLVEGDAVSRVVYVHCPVASLLQGPEDDEFIGNKFWLKGVSIRGQLSMSTDTPTATGALVRFTLLWSRDQGAANMSTTLIPLTSGTTVNTNPAQTAPNVNPRFFAYTTSPFTGHGYVTPFDTTRHKVIRSFSIPVNPSGDVETGQFSIPTPFNCYVRIGKMQQVEDHDSGDLSTPPMRFKYGTYWWVIQCIASNTNPPGNDPICTLQFQSHVYYRDI